MKKVAILVADDMPAINQLIRQILAPLGCDPINYARTAEDAVSLYNEKKPDIVFLDINMPGTMDGIDALEAIKKANSDAYVVMITGQAERDSIQKAQQMQANGYVVKPFSAARITKVYKSFLLELRKKAESATSS